jgi:iron-sulfur cluster assembly protein
MLTLSGPAVQAIRILTVKSGMPANSGLRISHQDAAGSLELCMSPGPDSGDEIIEADGARVFLHAEAAAMLSGRELGAEISGDEVVFLINERPE